MNDQRARVTDIGEVREQFQALHEGLAGFQPALDAEGGAHGGLAQGEGGALAPAGQALGQAEDQIIARFGPGALMRAGALPLLAKSAVTGIKDKDKTEV